MRAIKSVELTLNDGNRKYQLRAVGKFEKLKDITYFTERALEGRVEVDEEGNPIPDYHYSLITSLPIERNGYYNADLLFLIDNESKENFLLLDDTLEYTGIIQLNPFSQKTQDKSVVCFKFAPEIIMKRIMVSTSNIFACNSPES